MEQYPEDLRNILTATEHKLEQNVVSVFSKFNYNVYNWGMSLVQDAQNKIKDNAVEKKLKKELRGVIKIDDFILDLSIMIGGMMSASSREYSRIQEEVGTQVLNEVMAENGMAIGGIYDMSVYEKICIEREKDLAKELFKTTINGVPLVISQGIAGARTIDDVGQMLQDLLAMNRNRPQLIARTETRRGVTEAIITQMDKLGVEEYYIETAIGACEICNSFSADDHTKEEIQNWDTHPNCRCIPRAVVPDSWLEIGRSIKNKDLIIKKLEKRIKVLEDKGLK